MRLSSISLLFARLGFSLAERFGDIVCFAIQAIKDAVHADYGVVR
jgi:hypothetical protein